MNDIELGKIVVNTFVKYQMRNYFWTLITYNDVLATQKYPDNFLDGLGLQFRIVLENDQSSLDDAMNSLSKASNGKIPSQQSFHAAIRDRAISPTAFQAAAAVISGTATELARGAQSLGNNLIDTAKVLNKLLPFIILGGVAFFLYKNKDLLVLKK